MTETLGHEYFLILYGVIAWEIVQVFRIRGLLTTHDKVKAMILNVRHTMGAIGLEIAFDDEILKLLPWESITWWMYFLTGFLTDWIRGFLTKPKR